MLKNVQPQGTNEHPRRRSESYGAQGSEICNVADDFFQHSVKQL